MKAGHVKINFIRKDGIRLDALCQLSDGHLAYNMVTNCPCKIMTLKDVTLDIFNAERWKRVYVNDEEHGYRFIGSSSMLQADMNNVKYISRKYTIKSEAKVIKKGMTLVSCSGTIGNTVFANAKHAGTLASQHVIRLLPNNILGAGYVYAYLSTKYGYALLTHGTYGGVIRHIEPVHIKNMPIPVFSDEFVNEVDSLIQTSARLREEAADLLAEAKKILLDYVNTPFEGKKGCKTAKRTLKDIRESLQMRLDPPALMNESVITFEKIKNRCVKLGECKVNVYRPGIFKRSYVEDGFAYIKGSEIFQCNPFMRCEHISRTRTPFVDEMRLKESQILITCAGSVGQIKYITKEYEENDAIGSQDIIRLESQDDLYTAEYLFVYLQLPMLYDYMQSMKYGSVIERIEPFHVESIPVITPTKELSEKITSLIVRYKDCTYQAFCDEEKAIRMVEAEIEKWNK